MASRVLFSVGLILFNVGAAHAGKIRDFKERACSALIRPFQPLTLRELVREAEGAQGLIAIRYYRTECASTLKWDESIGLLRIDFEPNRAFRNRELLALVSGLALAYDGTEYYRAHSFEPHRRLKRNMPAIRFTLNYAVPLPEALQPIARTKPRFGQGPVPTGPILAEMKTYTHEYEGLVTMLMRADRFASMNQEASFHSLEVRTTTAGLRTLRQNLKAMHKFYGRKCTWPRILQDWIEF